MKKNSYYAVIAAKKRRGRRYAMVVPYEELERLMGSRVPVYFQKPCKSERAAEEQLDSLTSDEKKSLDLDGEAEG